MYGGQACGALARIWVHKMQFYLNLEQQHDPRGQASVFGAEHHATYQERTEVTRIMGELEAALLSRPGRLPFRQLFCDAWAWAGV